MQPKTTHVYFHSNTDPLLRLPQVLALIPISKSQWWEGVRTGRFPKPIKLGPRTTCWKTSDIVALIEQAGR
jgi:predicted DNA-binding transcriptional regulator AlpA